MIWTNLSSFSNLYWENYSYQLMNEDFPAEWFPMSMMLIFFLGAKREKSRLLAISHSPLSGSMYNWWHSCKISICFNYNSCIHTCWLKRFVTSDITRNIRMQILTLRIRSFVFMGFIAFSVFAEVRWRIFPDML